MLFRFVITFLLRSKHLLISWLQSLFTVILEPKKIKFFTASTFSLSICHGVIGPDAKILVFLNVALQHSKELLHSFTLIKSLFSSSSLSALEGQAWSALFSPHDEPRNEVFYSTMLQMTKLSLREF